MLCARGGPALAVVAPLKVGDRVLARWARKKRRYPGVVAKVHGDGTYDVKYDDDGDVDAGLEAAYIEAAPAPPAPRRTRVSGDLV